MCDDVAGLKAAITTANQQREAPRQLSGSNFVPIRPNFNNLVDPLILRKVKAILLCDRRCDETGWQVRKMKKASRKDRSEGLDEERQRDVNTRR